MSNDVPGWGPENRGVGEPRSQLDSSGWQLNRALVYSSWLSFHRHRHSQPDVTKTTAGVN